MKADQIMRPRSAYEYKTEPYQHQREWFELTRDRDKFALLWEQGTGKSKVVLDTAAWLYAHGRIGALLVVSLSGTHRNWLWDEVPRHLPDWCTPVCASWYATPKAAQRDALKELYAHGRKGLRILTMNVEALATKRGVEFAKKFLQIFDALFVVDESGVIKNPSAKRTKNIQRLAQLANYRRILNGTPITKGPLDYYAQFRFLDPAILGFRNYHAFKHQFAEWDEGYNSSTGRKFLKLKRYINLPKLKALVAPHMSRVRKAECVDLPPKVYERVYVDLTRDQRRLYNSVGEELFVELQVGEATVELDATNVLSRYQKLQQITGGWLKLEDGRVLAIEGANPKLRALLDIVESTEGKIIIWARYRAEIQGICRALAGLYGGETVAHYYGDTKDDERAENKKRFQDKDDPLRFLVANAQSAGYSLTLHASHTVVYYSNSFDLELRLQSEDRVHRIGQTETVVYFDIEATDTLDQKLIKALRAKKNVAEELLDDARQQWI